MSRISRIVPTAVLTVAALALVAPAAQAKPVIAPSGGPNGSSSTSVSPIATSSQAAHRNSVPKVTGVVVTTGDMPLANPVKGSDTLGVGLLHASTVPSHVDSSRPVSVPATPSNGFDWTSAAIGAGLVGILMLMVAGGVGFRRRGQLAA